MRKIFKKPLLGGIDFPPLRENGNRSTEEEPLFQPVADPEPHRIHPDRRRDHRPCLAHRSAGLSKKSTFSFEKRTCFFV